MPIIYADDPNYKAPPSQPAVNTTAEQGASINNALPESASINVKAGDEEGASLLDQAVEGFAEGSKAIWNGVAGAVNATLDGSASITNFVQQVAEKGWDEASFDDIKGPLQVPTLDTKGYFVPEIVEDLVQFGASFWGVNKATPFFKGYEVAGKAAQWGADFVKGGIADIVGMKAQEENLSATLIDTFPVLEGSVLEYLANDGKDPAIEGRLRNALEGMGLGVMLDAGLSGVEAVMRHLKFKKALDKSKTPEELTENLKKEGIEVEDTPKPAEGELKATAEPEAPKASADTKKGETPEPKPEPEPKPVHVTVESILKDVDTGKREFKLLNKKERKALTEDALKTPDNFERLTSNINFATYASTSKEGMNLLAELADAHAKKMSLKRSTTEAFEEIGRRTALVDDLYGTDVSKLVRGMTELTGDIEVAASFEAQVATVLPAKANKVMLLAQKIKGEANNGLFDWNARRDFIKEFNDVQRLYITSTDLKTASARLLNSFKYTKGAVRDGKPIKDAKKHFVNLIDLFDEAPNFTSKADFDNWCKSQNITEEGIEKAVEAVLRSQGNPAAMLKQGKILKTGSWGQFGTFWFTQNILTSPATHLWNLAGNITKLASKGVEEYLGATANAIMNPRMARAEFTEARRYTSQLFHVFSVSLHLAENVGKKNNPLRISSKDWSLEGGSSKFTDIGTSSSEMGTSEYLKNIMRNGDPEAVLSKRQEMLADCLGFLAGTARLNSKLMSSEDEFFKQLEFQARQYATINRKLDEKGIFDDVERKQAYKEEASTWFTDAGLVNMKNKDAADALRMAEQATYSQDVANKTVAEIVKTTNKSPVLKLILPFVKTVWNVQVDTFEHTPLGILPFVGSKQLKEDLAAGGARARQAKGRVALGTFVMPVMWMLCDAGMITGELPKNPREREAMERAGVRPYSLRIGNKYISYDRLDPFGTLLGAVANVHQIYSKRDNMTEEKQDEIGSAIAASLLSAVMDKSFLSSLKEFMDVMGNLDKFDTKGFRWAGKQVQGFIPASGAIRFLANKSEDTRTESAKGFTANAVDPLRRLINNTAYEAGRLPTKYDWFTGEASSNYHYLYSKAKDDWVLDEMAYISATARGKPSRKLKSLVDLEDDQYSRLCQLHGTVKIGGKTLYEAVKSLMQSPQYDFNEEHHKHSLIGENESYKGKLVNRLIDKYRREAERQLVKEQPELFQKLKEAKVNSYRNKRGTNSPRPVNDRSPLSALAR